MAESAARRPKWLRWLFGGIGCLVFLEVAWVVGAYICLSTTSIKARVNRHPEKLFFDWQSGSSWFPGFIRLEGFTVRGQGRRDQWYGTAKHADLRVGLLPFFQKRILGRSVKLDGVVFRIRPRLDSAAGARLQDAQLPTIPGLNNPPEVPPTFRTNPPAGKRWTLSLPAIEITDLEELWIKETRLTGHGHFKGTVEHLLRGPFEASVRGMKMPDSVLWFRGAPVATNLDISLDGRLGPMRFRIDKGLALFELMDADAEVQGTVASLRSLQRAFGLAEMVALDGVAQFRVRGGVDRGALQSPEFELAIPAGTLWGGNALLATNLHVGARGLLDPVRLQGMPQGELLRRLVTGVQLRGEVLDAGLLANHLGGTGELGLEGQGRIDADLHFDRGRFVGPGHLKLESPALTMRLMKVSADGAVKLGIEVAGGTNDSTSTMILDLDHLRFRLGGQEAEAGDAGRLRLRAVAYDPTWHQGFRDVALDLDVGPLTLPDARVLNEFLPADIGGQFKAGGFRLGATYARKREGTGMGSLRLDGETLEFDLGDRPFSGAIIVAADFSRGTNREIQVPSATVVVTNVMVAGVRNRQPDGWHARFDIQRATIALDGPDRIAGDFELSLLDLRPLLAILREQEDSPRWAKLVPNVKNLRGSASMALQPGEVTLRDVRLRGAATEVLAQMQLRSGKPDGILYVRYGIISAGFDFRNGGTEWTIFGAKRAYSRHLREMGLTGQEPEDGNEEPAESRSP